MSTFATPGANQGGGAILFGLKDRKKGAPHFYGVFRVFTPKNPDYPGNLGNPKNDPQGQPSPCVDETGLCQLVIIFRSWCKKRVAAFRGFVACAQANGRRIPWHE